MASRSEPDGWRNALPAGIRPYTEAAPLAALFLGMSSGFPYAMIGATLTTRLKQDGIDKSTITAFTLVFLAYNFKFLWAWVIDGVRLPMLGRLGQRVSWMLVTGALVIAAVVNLALRRSGREHRRRSSRLRSWSASPARASTSSSTPTGSRSSSRASSASDRACRNMAGGSARPARARWRWSLRRAAAGKWPISPARRSRCPRCSPRSSWASPSGTASPPRSTGIARTRRGGVAAVRRVLPAEGRAARPALHPAPQDRRHACQPDVPAAVRRPRLHQ